MWIERKLFLPRRWCLSTAPRHQALQNSTNTFVSLSPSTWARHKGWDTKRPLPCCPVVVYYLAGGKLRRKLLDCEESTTIVEALSRPWHALRTPPAENSMRASYLLASSPGARQFLRPEAAPPDKIKACLSCLVTFSEQRLNSCCLSCCLWWRGKQ